jgi:hypothetical protein
MKKIILALAILLLTSVSYGQGTIIKNGGAIYTSKDTTQVPFKIYEYGAILTAIESDGKWVTVVLKDINYYVLLTDFEGKPIFKRKTYPIKLGMHFTDLVSSLGKPNWEGYIYDKHVLKYSQTSYWFKNDILVLIE